MKVFKNRTTRFLTTSLVCVIFLCVLVFSSLAFHMNKESTQTINQVGTMYMSNMSQQISMHFSTTISLRLDQLDVLVSTIPPSSRKPDSLYQELCYQARARNFDYLGLYSTDGTLEMLYGDQLEITDPGPFLTSLNNGEKKVAISVNSKGEKVILLGISTTYPMADGEVCTALVAGLPASYISETLSLEEDEDQVYSFIIRQDGSFVIRNAVSSLNIW